MPKNFSQFFNNERVDFRFIPFGAVILYVLALIFSEFYLGSYAVVGNYFRIYPIPYFVDLEILLCGVDAIREGLNPYEALCYENEAYFNYPYLWGFLSVLPFMTASNHIYIGSILAILFFCAVYFFIGKLKFKSALIYTLILISPAVMLGIERGNSDVIIFLGLMLIPLFFYKSKLITSMLILFMSMLKIFPIGAGLCLLKVKKNSLVKSFWLLTSVILLFLIYIYVMFESIVQVSAKTPRPFKEASYGLGGFPSFIINMLDISKNQYTWVFLGFAFSCVSLFIAFFKYFNKRTTLPNIKYDRKGIGYLMGSGIFLLTCLIGYNWEYRLIFLIFTIPQILSWSHSHKLLKQSLMRAYLLLLWCSLVIPVLAFIIPRNLAYTVSYVLTLFLVFVHLFVLLKYIKHIFENAYGKNPISLNL